MPVVRLEANRRETVRMTELALLVCLSEARIHSLAIKEKSEIQKTILRFAKNQRGQRNAYGKAF